MHAFDWLVIAGYLALFLGVAWSVIAKNKDTADDSRQTFARHAAYAGLAVATLLLAVWIGLGRFVLKKLLTGLAMPCGLVWLGIGMAFYLALLQRSKGLSWLLGVVLIGYTVAGNALVGQWLMGTLEEQFYSIDAFAGEPFETVVVLGGCTEQLANGQVQLGSSGDRVALAARLFCSGQAKQLVATGAKFTADGLDPVGGAKAMARIWRDLGIPPSDIVTVGGRDTKEELQNVKVLLDGRSETRVGLLTSAWHLPRALRLARREGLSVVPIPADFNTGQYRPLQLLLVDMIPSFDALVSTSLAVKEYLAFVVKR